MEQEEYTIEQLCYDIQCELHSSNKDEFKVQVHHDSDKNIMYATFEKRGWIGVNEYALDTPFIVAYVNLDNGEYHRCYSFRCSVINHNIDLAFEMYSGYRAELVYKLVSKNA